jgi:hypothetical protein
MAALYAKWRVVLMDKKKKKTTITFTQVEMVELRFSIISAILSTEDEIKRCESLPEKDEEMEEYIQGLKLELQRRENLKEKLLSDLYPKK